MAASPPPEGVITVVSSTTQQVDALEQQLAALTTALQTRVAGAQADTLRALQLLDSAAEGLEASAREVAARRDELLLAARRLATELRGLDLLAGHVQSVDELVRKLEAQAAEVVRLAGAAKR